MADELFVAITINNWKLKLFSLLKGLPIEDLKREDSYKTMLKSTLEKKSISFY